MLNIEKKVLLLIGSPKPDNSTSESLGKYLIAQLPESYESKLSIHGRQSGQTKK